MRNESGFTLIELLVSLTLVGLLFVLLLGGLRFGTRAWERGTDVADAGDTIRTVQALLRTEIERACPRRDPVAGHPEQPGRVRFTGDATTLNLLAPAPAAAGGRGCTALNLRVQPDGALYRLTLGSGSVETDLLRHARSIAFAYLPTEGGWMDRWSGQTDLPALVRLRATFPPGDARAWPELFAAPRISAEVDCTYDPATKSCRGS